MTNKLWKRDVFSSDLAVPTMLAILQLTLQMAFHGNYGYFRDELYFIACSDHLDFGYVDHPPLAIAILWVNRLVLGDSLYAMRFLPSVAGAVVVLLAALTARKLGGGKFAQGLASFSIVAAPGLFGHAQLFSLNSFDVLFWAIAGYIMVCLLTDDRPMLWILFGLIVGLGMLNKYTMAFMVIGLCVGLLLTRERKQFLGRWFWLGGAVAAAVFLPHVIWEIDHGFPTLEFLRNASMDKNVHLGALDFLMGQLQNMNYFNAPLWIGGIYFFFRCREGRYRALAWIFPVVFLIMVVGNGKVYYMSSAYPLYLAGGTILFEQLVREKSRQWLKPAFVSSLIFSAVTSLPFALPFLSVEGFIQYQRLLGITPRADEKSGVAVLPQYLSDQFGWEEMVDTVACVYKKLTPEEQTQCVVYARSYGQAAAIDFFGKKHGLPGAICAHNNYWLWGPGQRTGNTAIIIGWNERLEENLADLHRYYEHVELAARTTSKYCMPMERGRLIFICRGMNTTIQKVWPKERFYI